MSSTRNQIKTAYRFGISAIGLFLLITCSADSPKIYILNGGTKSLTTFRQISHTARTAAGTTVADFRFVDNQSAQLDMTLEFKKAVPPEFTGGVFKLETGGETYRGEVTPVNFRYLGGQGDGVSIGGDFRISTPDNEYHVHLPLTAIETFGY